MVSPINVVKRSVRQMMAGLAAELHELSGGHIKPDAVTLFGLAMHLPVAWLIATGDWYWAAAGLVIFGLLDTLDGELARLQGTASVRGMLLDASTDRIKETLLYSGAAYALASGPHPAWAAWAAAACGASLCVSYIKAKGEAAVAAGSKRIEPAVLNRMFADGLMSFEIRMVVLLAGLLSGQLAWSLVVIAVLSGLTAAQRLVRVSRQLS